jgi:hypothetical protein
MKAFKIKKRSQRQAYFISGESVTSFAKPKLPLVFFKKTHPPALFKRLEAVGEIEVVEAKPAMTVAAEKVFVDAAGRVSEYRLLVKPVEISETHP